MIEDVQEVSRIPSRRNSNMLRIMKTKYPDDPESGGKSLKED